MPDHDTLVQWQRQLETAITGFASVELRHATERISTPGVHRAAAAYLTRPSKRLMGMGFLHAAAELGALAQDEDLMLVATALEARHGAILLHDDIVDGDVQRGGQPTAHCALAGQFGTDEARSAALFAGDVLAGLAPVPILRCDLPPTMRVRLTELFQQSTAAVAAGQVEQLSLDVRDDPEQVTEHSILRVHARHFVPYLVCSIDMAGALCGLDDTTLGQVQAWATPLCQAFQIANDVAGFTELARVLGKGETAETALTMANTSDLARRRRTVVVRAALDRLPEPDRGRLLAFLRGEEADLTEMVGLISSSGAVRHCENLVKQLQARISDRGGRLPLEVVSALQNTWSYMQDLYDLTSPVSRLYLRARSGELSDRVG